MDIKEISITVFKNQESLTLSASLAPDSDLQQSYLALKEKAYKLLNLVPYRESEKES